MRPATYLLVAALIFAVAFAIGQVAPGMGAVFAIAAATLWTAYSVRKAKRGSI